MDRDDDDLDERFNSKRVSNRYQGKFLFNFRLTFFQRLFEEKPDFQKEISCQLYGFGDAKNPYKETVGKQPLLKTFSKLILFPKNWSKNL